MFCRQKMLCFPLGTEIFASYIPSWIQEKNGQTISKAHAQSVEVSHKWNIRNFDLNKYTKRT